MNDSESLLVRHFHVMPVGWDPRRILILPLHDEAAARRLESPLSGRSSNELLPATGCNWGLEQHFLPLLVPDPMVGHADDDVRLVGRGGGRLVEQCFETVAGHAELCLDLVEDAEVVVIDHAVDVALVAQLGGFRQQHHADNGSTDEAEDQHPDSSAAVREDSYCHATTSVIVVAGKACALNRSIPS